MGLVENLMDMNQFMVILSQILDIKDPKIFEAISEIARQDNHIPDLEVFFNSYKEMKDYEFLTFNIPNFPISEGLFYEFMREMYSNIVKDRYSSHPEEDLTNPNYDWNKNMLKDDFGYFVEKEGICIEAPVLFEVILRAGYGERSQILLLMEMLIPLFRNVPCGVHILKLCTSLAKHDKNEISKQGFTILSMVFLVMLKEMLKDIISEDTIQVSKGDEKIVEEKIVKEMKFNDETLE